MIVNSSQTILMVIEIKRITLRSPQIFANKNTLLYFLAASFLTHQKKIKFKILSRTPWCYSNSFAKCDIRIIVFPTRKKLHFNKHILKRYKNYFVRKHFEKVC